MGFETHVFTSSDKNSEKIKLMKDLGASKIFNWTKNEHLIQKNVYSGMINTLPCDISEE